MCVIEDMRGGDKVKRQARATESAFMGKLKINPILTKKGEKRMKKTTLLAVVVFTLSMSSFVIAQIPEVGPPTPVNPSEVNPSTGTATSPSPKQKVCVKYKTVTVKYVCGTEQKCSQVKIMDSYTTFHYETVCVDVEKYCSKTVEECAQWGYQ